MKVILDREDLKSKYKKMNCSQTKFYHFRKEVQAVILKVNRAEFWEYDRRSYNAIIAPKEKRS